ncbi:MAG TPA: ferredoxin [Acidimicrobiales bacterium]|nr:ferredoxin [Acidimicrobiales bacterium]
MDLDVVIDSDVCMGSGNCISTAPDVFALDDDSVAFVVDPSAPPEDTVVTAARNCPTRAITVRRNGVSLI